MAEQVHVQVPATTSNLAAGFDCLGCALNLHNTVTLTAAKPARPLAGMFADTGGDFFQAAEIDAFPYRVKVTGEVPISRGLGSSVTVRLGILAGLNRLAGEPLGPDQLLQLLVDMEGHPDNAVPAFTGGFAVCSSRQAFNVPVKPRLKYVCLIPATNVETDACRQVLPRKVPLGDAVLNLQHTGLITAAFFTERYQDLAGLLRDSFHQRYRAENIPGCFDVFEAARAAGALDAFISGSGSTLIALSLKNHDAVAKAMLRAAKGNGLKARTRILQADNRGYRVR
ncbi:MAG: homoserine kinase [Verrucomicrobiota bacterium]